MTEFHHVPVVEIHRDNFQELWPSLLLAVKSSSFVAIDTELSGLGDRRQLNAKDVDDRFTAMSHIAETRSILSLGLAFYSLQPDSAAVLTGPARSESGPASSQPDSAPIQSEATPVVSPAEGGLVFKVQTFNIFTLCSEEYMVEPLSLKFLVDHGFDFNKQYSHGLPYARGNDKELSPKDAKKPGGPFPSVRRLFSELVVSQVPVVLHNAMVDLVFMYHSLYAQLPIHMSSFLADLSEVFGGGVYDTKYMTEFKARMSASFLEFVFRKCQRENTALTAGNTRMMKGGVKINFLDYSHLMPEHVVNLPCSLEDQPVESEVGKLNTCKQFAGHGWCPKGINCPNSHDVDLILDQEDKSSSNKRRRRNRVRRKRSTEGEMAAEEPGNGMVGAQGEADDHGDCPSAGKLAPASQEIMMECQEDEAADGAPDAKAPKMQHSPPPPPPLSGCTPADHKPVSRTSGHRAGFDAFMTGYIFACYVARYGTLKCLPPAGTTVKLADLGLEEFHNKVYLTGKSIPLQITKSGFAKTSSHHKLKYGSLFKKEDNSPGS